MEVIETGPEPEQGKSTPEALRKQEPYWRTSTAAAGPGIAAVELFDVELGRRECSARTGLPAFRTKVAFVGRVSAPFAKAAPEAAQETRRSHCGLFHQSSPWAALE